MAVTPIPVSGYDALSVIFLSFCYSLRMSFICFDCTPFLSHLLLTQYCLPFYVCLFKPIRSSSCAHTPLAVRLFTNMVNPPWATPLKHFLSQQLSSAISSSAGDGTLSISQLHGGVLSALSLCRSCVCGHNIRVFKYTTGSRKHDFLF